MTTQLTVACYDTCFAVKAGDQTIARTLEESYARLFASAPETAQQRDELLQALKACEEYIAALAEQTGNGTDTFERGTMAGTAQFLARAAIAKATGGAMPMSEQWLKIAGEATTKWDKDFAIQSSQEALRDEQEAAAKATGGAE